MASWIIALFLFISPCFSYKPVVLIHGVMTGGGSMEMIAHRIQEVNKALFTYSITWRDYIRRSKIFITLIRWINFNSKSRDVRLKMLAMKMYCNSSFFVIIYHNRCLWQETKRYELAGFNTICLKLWKKNHRVRNFKIFSNLS